MQIQIAFRHMDSSDALKEHVTHKLQRLDRFGDILVDTAVTLSKEGHRSVAEFVLSVKGDTLKAKEESEDMYMSIDRGVETAERLIKRHRDVQREKR
jgi:putative sigma-54 modulation protein